MRQISGDWLEPIKQVLCQLNNTTALKAAGLHRDLVPGYLKKVNHEGDLQFLREQVCTYCTFLFSLVAFGTRLVFVTNVFVRADLWNMCSKFALPTDFV